MEGRVAKLFKLKYPLQLNRFGFLSDDKFCQDPIMNSLNNGWLAVTTRFNNTVNQNAQSCVWGGSLH